MEYRKAPALFLCCAVFSGLIRKQIAQILGLGFGDLCQAGRPEGLPFFWQKKQISVTDKPERNPDAEFIADGTEFS